MVTFLKRDVLTPANAVSLIGLLLSIAGSIYLDTLSGVILVGIGRILDVLDGHIARQTHTSELGALVDAVFDKLALTAIVIAAALHGIVFLPLLIWITVLNIINATCNIITRFKGRRTGSTLDGKHTMFLENISLGLLLLAHFVHINWLDNILLTTGILTGSASIPLGLRAAYEYARTAFSESV